MIAKPKPPGSASSRELALALEGASTQLKGMPESLTVTATSLFNPVVLIANDNSTGVWDADEPPCMTMFIKISSRH